MIVLAVQEKSRTNIYVDVNMKNQAKEIFNQYGLSLSQAVNIFLTQSVLNRGLPFDVKIPNDETLQAMKDVETGENYEDVTLEDLKK
ncbi:MAG: DNA-damage-inducible protein J [uncultured Sulfurovum sp.]|uniref:DNA-damage-inducible protein J n=1 Tax=uncultured Sulfurovum sp. TaxID=269237 RepID=A0A6S6TJX6_9BACT|nr:MAG: DNA-damage-inducible protein J [uncultured Sulfurovum sp.]